MKESRPLSPGEEETRAANTGGHGGPPLRAHTAHAILLVAGLYLLYRVRAILAPFILGLVIAYIFDPILDRLQRQGMSRNRAIFVTYMVFVCFATVVFVFGGRAVIGQFTYLASAIPGYVQHLEEKLPHTDAEWETYLQEHLPASLVERVDATRVRLSVETQLRKFETNLGGTIQHAIRRIWDTVRRSVAFLLLIVLTPITTFFFMREIDPLRERVVSWIPEEYKGRVFDASTDVNAMLAGFFRGQLLVMCGVFLLSLGTLTVASRIWHFQGVLLIAALQGLLCVIPVAGFIIALLTGVLVAFLTSGSLWQAGLGTAATMVATNLIFDYYLTPRIVGERVGVHPLVVMFAIMAGAEIMGIVGMLVAVPVAATIKIGLLHFTPEVLAELKSGAPVRVPVEHAEEPEAAIPVALAAQAPDDEP